MASPSEKNVLPLLKQLSKAGIWIQCPGDGRLKVGPERLVRKHPDLIEQIKTYKRIVLNYIEGTLIHDLFGKEADGNAFETEECPECHQRVYVMGPDEGGQYSSRRLSIHRMPDNQSVCIGGNLAIYPINTELLVKKWLEMECKPSVSALLTWTSAWGSFECWCIEHKQLPVPPQDDVKAALSEIVKPCGKDMWEGYTVPLKQYFGDDEDKEDVPFEVHPKKKEVRQQTSLFKA